MQGTFQLDEKKHNKVSQLMATEVLGGQLNAIYNIKIFTLKVSIYYLLLEKMVEVLNVVVA